MLAEIKSYQNGVSADVKSISEFNGGGYKRSRIAYSMLAVMFAIIDEYDGDIRFKKDALAARELFGRVGGNLKVNTPQSFNESKARAEDLGNLIRGDSLTAPPGIDPKAKWSEKVANRPPLMTRLNVATEERLNKALSDAGTFNKSLETVLQESQVVAAISAGIQREGYEHTDDNTYLGFAHDMQKSAMEISAAAKAKNYDGARAAYGAEAKVRRMPRVVSLTPAPGRRYSRVTHVDRPNAIPTERGTRSREGIEFGQFGVPRRTAGLRAATLSRNRRVRRSVGRARSLDESPRGD
ncbi:MAG: hypothetical protein QM811_02310 [Pirellulales bacterium]